MADSIYDIRIQTGDPITVTFTDGTTLTGDFVQWFPDADGPGFQFTVPQGAADIAAITSSYYVDDFRHVQKLTPTTP